MENEKNIVWGDIKMTSNEKGVSTFIYSHMYDVVMFYLLIS